MKKRILSILLSVLMVLTLVPQTLIFSSAAVIESGNCGENLTYTLDDTGKLTISGNGELTDSPWYSRQKEIKTVVIEKGVTSIGYFAFYGCTSLRSITIPASVNFISDTAFEGCTAFTDITVDADNKEYSSSDGILLNKDKTRLLKYPQGRPDTDYTVPDGIEYIDFTRCHNITDITIPEGVTGIWFTGCSNLKDITIPKSVTSICYGAFYDCSSLASVTMPDSIVSIDMMAFSECSSLSDVYYEGSEAQWEHIRISYDNYPLLTANIHYNINEHQHSFGEWVITKKPTYSETGKKERRCSDCNKRDTAVIPVLKADTVIKAENAGVSLKYDKEVLKEKVKLNVNEKFEGGAFEVINAQKGTFRNRVFDINLTGSKGEVQPEGFVLVGIPLPEGYREENTVVYYVSEEDNSLTKMNSYVKDGIIWFETDHFSAYAVVDETKNLPGDMDGDGKLTAADARLILRASVGLEELSNAQNAAADVDNDKKITAADARIILRRSVGLSD